jgi:hypothetical protein
MAAAPALGAARVLALCQPLIQRRAPSAAEAATVASTDDALFVGDWREASLLSQPAINNNKKVLNKIRLYRMSIIRCVMYEFNAAGDAIYDKKPRLETSSLRGFFKI